MRTKLAIAAVLAVVFAVAGVTIASADSKGSRHDDDHARVIKLFSRTADEARAQFVDVPPLQHSDTDPPTLGDHFVFSDDLFDHEGGTKVGIDGAVCTVVRLDPLSGPTEAVLQCQATISLADGQITVQGLFTTPLSGVAEPFDLAVTGGTGAYEGAEGHLTVEELSDTDANLTVVLTDD
jgi:hypothetical protein